MLLKKLNQTTEKFISHKSEAITYDREAITNGRDNYIHFMSRDAEPSTSISELMVAIVGIHLIDIQTR